MKMQEDPSQPLTSHAAINDAPDGDDPNEKTDGKLHLPVGDIDKMHEAIPYLPLPIALFCFVLNISIPGAGTMFSGIVGMCIGQPRMSGIHEGRISALVLLDSFAVCVTRWIDEG
ncbi:unnamed protein product [Cylicocyclus nassatus]|uniref:Uncharacterized protein n=1 Tax=Cylicocyclus nassatus TaxID=53992 RepID=A0AA36DPG7_CYLNA|nr:unnamed protein product [Cylicocyclus nassatus]